MTEPSRPSPPERGTTLEVPQFNTLPEPEKLEPETPETEKPETEKLGPEKPETEKSEPKKPEVIDSKKDHGVPISSMHSHITYLRSQTLKKRHPHLVQDPAYMTLSYSLASLSC